MDQLTKRIQENKSANSFDALKEENLDQINPPALLDAKKIKGLMTAPEHTLGLQKTKAVQEFITANAHKFNEADHARIINLCKPKLKPTVKQLGDAHAYPKSKPTVKQMGDALKEQIQTMDEDTKISVTFLGLRRVHFSFSTCLLSLSHHVTNYPSISIT